MKDQNKTKGQLIEELRELRQRNAEFEKSETEHKKMEQFLEESQEKYSNITELITDGIITFDLKGVVSSVNNAFLELTGFPGDKIVGRHFTKLPTLRVNDIPGYLKLFSSMIMGKIPEPSEFLWIHKDGTERWGEGYFCFLRRGRKKVGMQAILKDITERKQTEEALRESEERYRELANSVTDIFFALDKDLRYSYWNKASEELTGISAKDAIGKSLYELFPDTPETRKAENEYLKVLRTKQPRSFVNEYHLRGKDFFFDINVYPTEDGISVFTKDITERKQAEVQASVANERLQYLLSTSPAVIYTAKPSDDYEATFISENVSRIAGYKPREFVENPSFWIDHVHPDDLQKVHDTVPRLFENPHDAYEYRFKHRNGNYIWVRDEMRLVRDEKGNPIEIVGYWADITERKKAEEALRESEEKYRVLVENATDFIYMINRELKILTLNKAAAKLWKKEPKEIIGKSILEIFPEQIAIGYSEDLKKVFETGKSHSSETRMVVGKTETWINTSLNPVRDNEGKIIAVMGVTRDITEYKKAEAELEKEMKKAQRYLDVAGVIFVVVSAEQKVTLINKKGCEVLGYKEEEIIGKNWFDNFLPERMKDEVKEVSEKILAGKIGPVKYFENPVLTKNGEERIIAWHNTEFRDENVSLWKMKRSSY